MSMLINPFIFSPGIVGPIVTFRGVGNSGDSFNIGAAAADRVVVALCAAVRGSPTPRTLSSLVFDGVAGTTPTTTGVGAGSSSVTVGMASKLITAGTTCTPTATYSGGVVASKVALFTITGQVTNTPGDSKAWKTGDAAATINVANPGCVLMVAAGTDGTLGSFTLTGVGTKDDDQSWGGLSTMQVAFGHETNLAAEAARALAAVNSNTVKGFVAHTYS
ncbi:hypothetical protein [Mesorhizobium sp. M4B.F.Ca.ET.013.02.1.1]|uniref:hypothetical protein n=1 Tax=Mesorhizobium sp. M4B.F.Ca.ET.013.02.1.1 TaxID=2496755 RepID=UPI000FD315E6|nr:hypothetical protein [Mesorhizobium sp. M4B.F.Ca.ET.013.02.1.1]RUW19193.1 hypothetical protein EOA34_30255 [Mesorhizobium sp. M4B.F.Ca.ET.013.02.1.1]